jgi:hypothetical protein
MYEALDFVARGKVKTIVEAYPPSDAAKAYERVAQGKARFPLRPHKVAVDFVSVIPWAEASVSGLTSRSLSVALPPVFL